MILISKEVASPKALRFSALDAGRLFHVRVMREQVVDVLGAYQHAWQSQASHSDVDSLASRNLLQLRAMFWQKLRNWVRAVPARNSLVALGDFNCCLTPSHPNVGSGTAPHKSGPHSDQPEFQSLVQTLGLLAANTWGCPGRASGTFLQFNRHAVQIDYILLRLPCSPAERLAKVWQDAPIVHPTGLRHAPLLGYLNSTPSRPQQSQPNTLRNHEIHSTLAKSPHLAEVFRCQVQTLLPENPIEETLVQAWKQCTQQLDAAQAPLPTAQRPRQTLKTFWEAKHELRSRHLQLDNYWGPVIWYAAESSPAKIRRHFPGCTGRLRLVLLTWKSQIRFMREDKALRQRAKQSKIAQVNHLIAQAELTAPHGLQGLYRLSKQLASKSSKKSIHFRHPDGKLMTDQEELHSLTVYFQDLYRADLRRPTNWSLRVALHISLDEVLAALRQMSPRKALPPKQAPAVLWTIAQQELAPRICDELNQELGPGPLQFPSSWNASYMTLIPKPNKQPTQPANLRPICILPALPKLLARILATRLKPYVQQALHNAPQFAYLSQRQAADALDRAFAHCCRVRERLQALGRSVFKLRAGARDTQLDGGLTLSLDLSKAYDRLPRTCLLESLTLMQVPADLVAVIMHIHDSAYIVLHRHDLESQAPLGQGIRQGCGLSPLLWIGYTLLIFQRLQPLVPAQSLTGYADDFLINWELSSPRDFANACTSIPKILAVLHDLGMNISLDKTVILLAIKGRAAPQLLKTYTCYRQSVRHLRLSCGNSVTFLPIKTSHTYLGAKIGYGLFERETAQFRMSQAWMAFHRLHPLLKHQSVPVSRRLQLWYTCVWSITRYALSSTGLDSTSAQQLYQHVNRQLRVVARSPAHISHEDNSKLLDRLGIVHPLLQLAQATQKRIALSRPLVSHLQPAHVVQWWDVVINSFRQHTGPATMGTRLVEVSQILQIRCVCRECGQSFPTHHALQVHRGKAHKPKSHTEHPSTPSHPHPRPRRNDEQFRQHALHGMPTCKHCLRSFHGWPEFSGHFRGSACPILHSDPPGSPRHELSRPLAKGASAPERTEKATTEPLPLFQRTDLQQLAANKQLKELASAIRTSKRLQFCPECGQWCTKPSYLSRHANQIHPHMAMHHKAICSWAQRKTRLSQPCEWCGETYGTRQATHLQSCPVLWMCGHFFQRHASLDDTGQSSLAAAFKHGRTLDGQGRTSPSPGRVRAIRPIHEEGDPGHRSDGHSADVDPGKFHSPTDTGGHGPGPRETTSGPSPAARAAGKMGQRRGEGGDQAGTGTPSAKRKGQLRGRSGQSSGGTSAPGRHRQLRLPFGAAGPADTGLSGADAGKPATSAGPCRSDGAQDELPRGMGRMARQRRPQLGLQPRALARPRPRSPRTGRGQMEPVRQGQGSRDGGTEGDDPPPCTLGVASRRRNVHLQLGQTSSNPWSITSPLYTTATQWKAKKESDPTSLSLSQPLRSVLFYCVWASLLPQLRKMEEATEEEFIKEVKSRGLTEENSWLYLKWDNQAKKHQKDTQEPLEHVTAVQLVQQIMMLCTYPDTIGRFHALRPLTSNLTSDVIPFMLTLQNRTQESHQLYTCVRRLCRNSCTHLVGMTLRPSRLGRSPLAQQIDRLLKHI